RGASASPFGGGRAQLARGCPTERGSYTVTSRPAPASRAAASTSTAAAASWTATPTDLYSVICSSEVRPGFVPLTSSPSSAWIWSGLILPVLMGCTRSLLPAGGGASTAWRDSTHTSESAIVSSSISRPAGW